MSIYDVAFVVGVAGYCFYVVVYVQFLRRWVREHDERIGRIENELAGRANYHEELKRRNRLIPEGGGEHAVI